MIDEKIDKALTELEANLRSLESAREQVEKTVKSYNGLNSTTSEYVDRLGIITIKIQDIVDGIGKDYAKKVLEFEKDRNVIVNTSNAVMEKLANATDVFNRSLPGIHQKLKYSLFINIFLLIVIGVIVFLLLK